MTKTYPMTLAGKEKLKEELTQLQEKRRKKLDQQIKNARDFCDFSEDATFEEMVQERNSLEERIKTLESMLYNAKLIKPEEKTSSVIALGNSVTFVELPAGEKETYTIVGITDADPSECNISSETPIAKSLLGHEKNDTVFIQTPAGKIKVKIIDVR